jgi:hypothetical protein
MRLIDRLRNLPSQHPSVALAGLLGTEMVATRGKSVGVQLRELFAKVGSFYPVRENFRLTRKPWPRSLKN